jgi:hypothetical protein
MDVFARAWAIAKADSEEMKRITSTPSTGQDEDAAKRAKESEAAKIAEIQARNRKNRENLNKSPDVYDEGMCEWCDGSGEKDDGEMCRHCGGDGFR